MSLRKMLVLAFVAGFAKRAWDRRQAPGLHAEARAEPLAMPDAAAGAPSFPRATTHEAPLQYH